MGEILRMPNYWEIYDDCKNLAKELKIFVAVIPYSNYTCVTINVNNDEIFNKFKTMLVERYINVKEDPFLRSFYVK